MLEELGIALALLLVLEGILPFLSPKLTRQSLAMMMEMDDKSLRMTGLICMIFGVILLYLVR